MKSVHGDWSLQTPYWTVSGGLGWKWDCGPRTRDFPSSEEGVEAPEKGPSGHRKSLCLADRDSLLMFLMTVVPFGGSLQKGKADALGLRQEQCCVAFNLQKQFLAALCSSVSSSGCATPGDPIKWTIGWVLADSEWLR